MSLATSPLRNLLAGRLRPAPVVADPADMGTCFGLEMTLDQPAAESQPPAAAPRRWWQRLSRPRADGN